ncbi:hypothetical protein VC273_17415 [Xanthomonas nasturtii]|uniref:hypothetical protein n=1 Tax=Xanthomonas TaxID=338 RepID=UPI002B235FA6|nr:hypothetical protein [Xanthomonas nasturtii]MEA9557610.1 hypothetical protein [Xanthomonas nasturtii]
MNEPQAASLIVTSRRRDGRFMPFLAELSAQDFVKLVVGARRDVVIHIDWSQLISVISSEFDRMRSRQINDAFQALWLQWVDAPTYQKSDVRLQKFMEVSSRATDALAQLQSSVAEHKASLRVIRDENPGACLHLCSQYLAALMCYVHAKQELEISSFSNPVLLLKYAEWMEGILRDAYEIRLEVFQGKIRDSSHLIALAFDEDPELNLYIEALSQPADFVGEDLRLSYIKRHIETDRRGEWININVQIQRVSSEQAAIILRLRDLLRWATALRNLITNLGAPLSHSNIAVKVEANGGGT